MNDAIGKEIRLGDYVAGSVSNNTDLYIYRVIGFTAQRVRVFCIKGYRRQVTTRYPSSLVIIEPSEMIRAAEQELS